MGQHPTPEPKANEVLIKVHAAGVNRPDIMQYNGLYPAPDGASDILGLEVSGTIRSLGSNITHLNIGDKVCAIVTGGGYAEYCTAPALLCLAIPDSFDFVQAAALDFILKSFQESLVCTANLLYSLFFLRSV